MTAEQSSDAILLKASRQERELNWSKKMYFVFMDMSAYSWNARSRPQRIRSQYSPFSEEGMDTAILKYFLVFLKATAEVWRLYL